MLDKPDELLDDRVGDFEPDESELEDDDWRAIPVMNTVGRCCSTMSPELCKTPLIALILPLVLYLPPNCL